MEENHTFFQNGRILLSSNIDQNGRKGLTQLPSKKTKRKAAIAAMQFIVGAIFTFGGIALLHFSVGALDGILGIIHTSIGVTSFPVGFGILQSQNWGRNSAFVLNPIAIVFGILAEIILYLESPLPFSAYNDSVIGTIIGISFAMAVLVFLSRKT